jgi:hypothetical protein
MTIQKQIDFAMMLHKAGNTDGTVKQLHCMIRGAMSKKQADAAKAALAAIGRPYNA